MNFLEKDLETIVWENYLRCAEKGLDIDQKFFNDGKAYRQMNLMPYGIADLVYIRFSAPENLYYVQVIELKRGKIDTAAFLQAKRYLTAVYGILDRLRKREERTYKIALTSVIIGNEVELAGDFVFCLNNDHSCSAFTYSYGFDGIVFQRVGRDWTLKGAHESPQLRSYDTALLEHQEQIDESYSDYLFEGRMAHQQDMLVNGDWACPLVITADGVLFNEDLLHEDLSDALGDGAE